jgi:hypothetical protein
VAQSTILQSDPEIEAARRQVELAREELAARLRLASRSSQRLVRHAVDETRPVAVGVAVLGGAALLIGAVKLLRGALGARSSTRSSRSEPSVLNSVLRSALTSTATAVATRLVQNVVVPRLLAAAHARQVPQQLSLPLPTGEGRETSTTG